MTVHRLPQRYRNLLCEELAQTVERPDNVHEELDFLPKALQLSSSRMEKSRSSSHAVDHWADRFSPGLIGYETLTDWLPVGKFEPPPKHAN